MKKRMQRALFLLVVLGLFATTGMAATIPIGYISWDVNIPGSAGSFDIINQSGPNHSIFPDMTWPVLTTVNLSSLALGVDFVGGGHTNFGSSYFTLALDGISFDGGVIPIGGANPLPRQATLTGTFSPLNISLNNATSTPILSTFSATIPLSAAGLSDGDFAIINATTPVVGAPEPASMILLGLAFGGLFLMRRVWRVVPNA